MNYTVVSAPGVLSDTRSITTKTSLCLEIVDLSDDHGTDIFPPSDGAAY